MSRSQRLMDLIQVLRRHRRPVSGRKLAEETGVSLRTLYRDIATLQAQGAGIDGEAGIGYVLKPGFLLPPLMFTEEEIEALVLGARWVGTRTDRSLSLAAVNALAKIEAVLPRDLRERMETSNLMVGPAPVQPPASIDLAILRAAIRKEEALALLYADAGGNRTEREIWPFAIGFFENVRVLVAWCCLRKEIRHFRTDRMVEVTPTGKRYPVKKSTLLRQWKAEQGIAKTTDII